MTFVENELNNLQLDNDDEWQIEDDIHLVSVKFYGLETVMFKLFDIDLDNQFPNGWIDSYAYIDPLTKTVTEIYLNFSSGIGVEYDRELDIKITNSREQHIIYDKLKTKELDEFVDAVEFEEV